MNGLARALFFGKRGEFRERGIQDQLIVINHLFLGGFRFLFLPKL